MATALDVDSEWALVRTDFTLYAARHPDVAQRLAQHRFTMSATLAAALRGALDRHALPETLRDADRLAGAVLAVHTGAITELLLDDLAGDQRAQWLHDLLLALLSLAWAGQLSLSGLSR